MTIKHAFLEHFDVIANLQDPQSLLTTIFGSNLWNFDENAHSTVKQMLQFHQGVDKIEFTWSL